MSIALTYFRHLSSSDRFRFAFPRYSALILILAAWLPTACTRLTPPKIQPDLAAEQMVAELRQTNAGLTRFKCVGKMTLSGPNRPVQSFRAALAGQLSDHLRIDMFAPLGGSAGTVSSDGKHLFLVMHPSREYYKKRFGSGNLRHIIHMDVSVGDLLELLVGRVPINAGFIARLTADEAPDQSQLVFMDQWGRTRQRITVDGAMHPVQSVWYDSSQNPVYTMKVSGQQVVDGFVLAKQIELSAPSGERVALSLDRYEANAGLDESLFRLSPL